jgi:ribonuclease BN (tRNA processing enzyme)
MEITALGRGGMFCPIEVGHSNFLFEEKGKVGLGDCGLWTPPQLRDKYGVNPIAANLDFVYISHLHDDHAGGLGWLALYNYYIGMKLMGGEKLNLFIHHSLVDKLWSSLEENCKTLQGETSTLDTFFNVHSIMDDGSFKWQGWTFDLVQTLHVVSNRTFMHSFGLMVYKKETEKTFITTDTQFTWPCPLQVFYDQAKLILHDADPEYDTGVHAYVPNMVDHLDDETKAKMWIYHYNNKPDNTDDYGFAGFVETGQKFEI